MNIEIYDTTLRDGSQGEGVSFSLADKINVLKTLDAFGVDYVEGGWPGSNPKDVDFFIAARDLELEHTQVAAFGSTCRAGTPASEDINLRALVDCGHAGGNNLRQIVEAPRHRDLQDHMR